MRALEGTKRILLPRIGGLNDISFRSKLEQLFEQIPARELMPIVNNPRSLEQFLNEFIPRLEATRHYLTHYDPDQRALAFEGGEIQDAALTCWAVLTFWVATLLKIESEAAGDIALQAKKAMFLVSPHGTL
jgi:hypothetical protein